MSVVSQLIALAKHPSPSAATFTDVIYLTISAFKQPKPLFDDQQKKLAVSALGRSFPLFTAAFRQYDIGMNDDRRQNAQMSRSGLQFIADEMEDEPPIREKLQQLIESDHLKSIEEYIENTVGVEPENVTLEKIDLDKIPKSHYWWFYTNEDE
uniref:Uncharacterized protein n=1 Tax=Caenorhabditis japonica TaxID=281687 RepID=A0A8R1DRL4_CAEJA